MTPARTGALVLSLDFELAWGVHEKYPQGRGYEDALIGARQAVPAMLNTFDRFGISATWACVGFLMAQSREEVHAFTPTHLPTYVDPSLNAYREMIGLDEADDPLHFAASLIQQIQEAAGQEIGTHTWSHYYCGERGQDDRTFAEDLDAAIAIAQLRGTDIRSIVFPRNQHNPSYDSILISRGLTNYRGNPICFQWRFTNADQARGRVRRGLRLVEQYTRGLGDGSYSWDDIHQPSGLGDVRASLFLRPVEASLMLREVRLRRIRDTIRSAARNGKVVHLWWHPHNFGRRLIENISFLERVLEEVAACREEFGFQSMTMTQAAEAAR